jgi:hypothetical protein
VNSLHVEHSPGKRRSRLQRIPEESLVAGLRRAIAACRDGVLLEADVLAAGDANALAALRFWGVPSYSSPQGSFWRACDIAGVLGEEGAA